MTVQFKQGAADLAPGTPCIACGSELYLIKTYCDPQQMSPNTSLASSEATVAAQSEAPHQTVRCVDYTFNPRSVRHSSKRPNNVRNIRVEMSQIHRP